jgi:hypothetical protein
MEMITAITSYIVLFRFTAHWPQRPIQAWDTTANDWERGWQQMNSDIIILKRIKNSNDVSNFLNEVCNNLSILNKFDFTMPC